MHNRRTFHASTTKWLRFRPSDPGSLGYLTIWPRETQQPFVSTLNANKGLAVADSAIVLTTLPALGGIMDVFVTNPTDVIIDSAGFFGH
jgi:hypothetical protein